MAIKMMMINDGADNDYILMKEGKEDSIRQECRDQTREELQQ